MLLAAFVSHPSWSLCTTLHKHLKTTETSSWGLTPNNVSNLESSILDAVNLENSDKTVHQLVCRQGHDICLNRLKHFDLSQTHWFLNIGHSKSLGIIRVPEREREYQRDYQRERERQTDWQKAARHRYQEKQTVIEEVTQQLSHWR